MAYTLVKNHKIYITTESDAAGIKLATIGLYDAAPGSISAGTGIGVMDNVPLDGSSVAINMIGGVVSFSPTIDKQNEDVDFINGSTIRDSIEVRKTGELTLNLKKQNDVFARLYQSAPVGVNTTTAAVEVMNNDYPANNAEFGYRIIIFDGVKYMVFYHCTMTGYNSPPGNDKNMAITENIKFTFQDWDPDVAVGSVVTAKGVQ